MVKDMRFLNKAIMKQQGNIKELFTLIMNNPDLPIIAYVDGEIVADDGYSRWLGSWGISYIIEYVMVEMYEDYPEMVCKDDTEALEEFLYDCSEMTEEEIKEYIDGLQWIKAIAVNIDLP